MLHIRVMDYYSVIKRNEVLVCTTMWLNEPYKHYIKSKKPGAKDKL
jgi:hypothetical protein